MGMGNYFTWLPDVVIVIGAPGLHLSVVIPRGPRKHNLWSAIGLEEIKGGWWVVVVAVTRDTRIWLSMPLKELKTNRGGIVTTSKRFQPGARCLHTLLLSEGEIMNPPLIPFPVAGQREVAPRACWAGFAECKVWIFDSCRRAAVLTRVNGFNNLLRHAQFGILCNSLIHQT